MLHLRSLCSSVLFVPLYGGLPNSRLSYSPIIFREVWQGINCPIHLQGACKRVTPG